MISNLKPAIAKRISTVYIISDFQHIVLGHCGYNLFRRHGRVRHIPSKDLFPVQLQNILSPYLIPAAQGRNGSLPRQTNKPRPEIIPSPITPSPGYPHKNEYLFLPPRNTGKQSVRDTHLPILQIRNTNCGTQLNSVAKAGR